MEQKAALLHVLVVVTRCKSSRAISVLWPDPSLRFPVRATVSSLWRIAGPKVTTSVWSKCSATQLATGTRSKRVGVTPHAEIDTRALHHFLLPVERPPPGPPHCTSVALYVGTPTPSMRCDGRLVWQTAGCAAIYRCVRRMRRYRMCVCASCTYTSTKRHKLSLR